ncbi:hypothetical protein VNO80_19740 [Phaseolus coccineus]|uniref:Signal peptidase complex catalytic subunit SEC11 n=1 Tax=Phaseolus coccineus TaxID=3886 RepID=A0AAN9MHY4_PHACN
MVTQPYLSFELQEPNTFSVSKKKESRTIPNPTNAHTTMGWVADTLHSVNSIQLRELFNHFITLGLIVTSALVIWKALICVSGCQSPVVVVISPSMEPGFGRGDILFLHMSKDPIRAGDIVVYNIDGKDIPIVHRVIEVRERQNTEEAYILTKGDNNPSDDRVMYNPGQKWLQEHHIMGRAVGFLPYVGWVTIIMTDIPVLKYILIGALGLLVLTMKE